MLNKYGIKFESEDGLFFKSYLSEDDFRSWSNKKGYALYGNTVYPKGLKNEESVHFKQSESFFDRGEYELTMYIS